MLDTQEIERPAGFIPPTAFAPASLFLWLGVMSALVLACNSMIAMSYARR